MTSRTVDIHCVKCRRYLFSIMPRDVVPDGNMCDDCRNDRKKKGRDRVKQRRKSK